MSVRIFSDIEEAIAREIRRISFHEARTVSETVLKETYDPLSGEVVKVPIEPNFYDSSSDAGHINYPNFFIKILNVREDRFSGRVVPQYGKWCKTPVLSSPKAYDIILTSQGQVTTVGNDFITSAFQISKIQPNNLLRILEGNNKGTYIISSVTVNPSGNHTITLSSTLLDSLPKIAFDSNTRVVQFLDGVDLNTIKIGDVFIDSLNNSFNITNIDINNLQITIDGTTDPDLNINSKITRTGNMFTSVDSTAVNYIVMDHTKPILGLGGSNKGTKVTGTSPEIPLDAFYLVRIDSKSRQNHISILNRIWEEFNPPRTALPVIKRTKLSAEQILTVDIPTGGSNQITVEDTTNFNVGDSVVIIDDLTPTKRADGEGFERPFTSRVKSIISSTVLELEDLVPDTFKVSNCSKIISNTEFKLLMFHFQNHRANDNEATQYWSHEFTFIVQFWVDRLEKESVIGTITNIQTPIEDFNGNIII